MMITEAQLQMMKREIEGYKNDKLRAEATLAEVVRNIETQKQELAAEGINSKEDLEKMKEDINTRYAKLLTDVEKYRGVRR